MSLHLVSLHLVVIVAWHFCYNKVMFYKTAKILLCCLPFFVVGLFFYFNGLPAKALGFASDRIKVSWPGSPSDHAIKFRTKKATPPGGKIVVTPEGGFAFYPGFDYTDVDLATSSSSDGPFADRELSASSTAASDGVFALASSTDGYAEITLNSSYGIDPGVWVSLEFGTIATYGETGDRQIVNASATGSYGVIIETYDAVDTYIERARPMISLVEPINLTTSQSSSRSNGVPTGVLGYNTTETIMSLYTNFKATCRYSTVADTLYDDMVNQFQFTGNYFHSITVSGLTNNGHYDYFVRCREESGVRDNSTICIYNAATTTESCVDYEITFEVAGVEGGEEGEEGGGEGGGGEGGAGGGSGGGGSGGSGGGAGGGRGQEMGRGRGNYLPYPPLPGAPGVILSGWAYPDSDVVILKDGTEEGLAKSDANAFFGAFLADLSQGVYTFGLWSTDSKNRRSLTYSTTFWIDDGTQTTVSDIIIPPTIELGKNSLSSGEALSVFGQSAPNKSVEVWLFPQKEGQLKDEEIVKKSGVTGPTGEWSVSMDTTGLKGIYRVKAKSMINGVGESGFSQIIDLSIGAPAVPAEECAGADLNKDGRVNITDFSILLYWWGTDNACADQNHNGTVDLIDFSIMMYYWTG